MSFDVKKIGVFFFLKKISFFFLYISQVYSYFILAVLWLMYWFGGFCQSKKKESFRSESFRKESTHVQSCFFGYCTGFYSVLNLCAIVCEHKTSKSAIMSSRPFKLGS